MMGSSKGFTDITNYSFGTDIKGRIFSCIIPKNQIKISKKQINSFDIQTKINIGIYEGESEKYEENHNLGYFIIE